LGISEPLGTLDDFIKTNRAPIGCRERFAAQSRPLFRQRITTKKAFLDARCIKERPKMGISRWIRGVISGENMSL
jgi:hypothetical protein